MPFIFSCLTALHRPSHMMLKSKNGREYPHFLPDLNGKTSNFSPLCMMWTVDFCRIFFIILRKFPSTPNLLGFTHGIQNHLQLPCLIIHLWFSDLSSWVWRLGGAVSPGTLLIGPPISLPSRLLHMLYSLANSYSSFTAPGALCLPSGNKSSTPPQDTHISCLWLLRPARSQSTFLPYTPESRDSW